MYTRRLLLLAFLVAGQLPPLAPQPSIEVSGAVQTPLSLSAGDLAKMPRASLRATIHGTETAYQGVWLHEILQRAGVPLGPALRGKALACYVLAEARDGYQVVFSIGELDPGLIDNQILLADTANGEPLSGEQGRFRLVAPKDKHGARSIRMLTRLEVVQVRK
jgi:DMSO/TMAO reductase YedYZ molybdopterin-dependent catalytic subunit